MTEQSQLLSPDHFPCFRRVVTFLADCGLHSYGLRCSWFGSGFGQRHLFYPFTHPANRERDGWSEADEIILRQQEQESFHALVLVGQVFADSIVYRLALDHGHYRLRYSLTATGRQTLIHDLLAEKGILQYELLHEVSEGRMLPPYQHVYIEDCSGTIVTSTAVYCFWLDWVDGRHTLGEPSSFQPPSDGGSYWQEYAPEEHDREFPTFAQAVEGARRRLQLRRRIAPSPAEGKSETWEVREEEAKQWAE